jgi:hypothetical protein
MLNPQAYYLLGSSPSISPFATKLLLRLMGDFDLRRPRILNHLDLASIYRGWQAWEIKQSLDQLEEAGILEEMGSINHLLIREGRIMRLRKEMLLSEDERGEWLREDRDMRGRESLVREPGENWREEALKKKLSILPSPD